VERSCVGGGLARVEPFLGECETTDSTTKAEVGLILFRSNSHHRSGSDRSHRRMGKNHFGFRDRL